MCFGVAEYSAVKPSISNVTHSNLEKVLTHTSSSRSHRLTKASALPVAKYLLKTQTHRQEHEAQ